MSPALQADAMAVAVDLAEVRAAAVGRAVADSAEDLEDVARGLAGDPLAGGWAGQSGGRARGGVADAAAEARMLAGHCLYLADVLRVEGARLVRALIQWDDDEMASPGQGDSTAVKDADRALTARLREAADALAGFADPDTSRCIDLSASTNDDPRAVAELWHSLGPAERERLARDHPELGSVAGLSSATRDALNRTRLRRLLDAAGSEAGGAELAVVEEDLTALAAYLDDDPRRHLLSLHTDGRAVVSSGDPDSADRVVTMIPGTGSSVGSIAQTGERAEAMCEAAATADGDADSVGGVAGAASAVDAQTEACVSVAWQGYDAPDHLAAAGTSPAPARAHAEDLRTFSAGLDAVESMDGVDAPHTAVGYSYGSAVLGAAAADPQGLAADRMIHVGSAGASVDSLAEQWVDEGGSAEQSGQAGQAERSGQAGQAGPLSQSRPARPDEVVGVMSRWDPAPWWSITGVLGAVPGLEPFGGLGVDVTEPGSGPGSIGDAHGTYFDPGTVSLEEIGRLIADRD